MQIYHDKCFIEPITKIIAFNNLEFKKALLEIEEYRKKIFIFLDISDIVQKIFLWV